MVSEARRLRRERQEKHLEPENITQYDIEKEAYVVIPNPNFSELNEEEEEDGGV